MKVLLIYPYYLSNFSYPDAYPPVCLAYLAAAVRGEGIAVPKIIDLSLLGKSKEGKLWRHGCSDETIARIIRDEAPDVVGVSCPFSAYFANSLRILELARQNAPAAVTFIGGPHPTLFPEETINNSFVDFCVIGEGETTFTRILKAFAAVKDVQALKTACLKEEGVAFMLDGKPVVNPKLHYIDDLDSLPFPAWDLIDVESYFKLNLPNWSLRGRMLPVVSSRSCPNRCTFCSMFRTHGPRWRGRSAANLVDEILYLKENFGIDSFNIIDDNFSFDPKRVLEVCALLRRKGLEKLIWNTPNGLAVKTLNEEVLTAMKEAGCCEINVAIESGDEYICNTVIQKHLPTEKILEVTRAANRIGLKLNIYIVLGMPGETRESVGNTIALIRKFHAYGMGLYNATPYPGTVLYDTCLKNGWISKNYLADMTKGNFIAYTVPAFKTGGFDFEDLKNWRGRLIRAFVLHNFLEIIKWEFRQPVLFYPKIFFKRLKMLFLQN